MAFLNGSLGMAEWCASYSWLDPFSRSLIKPQPSKRAMVKAAMRRRAMEFQSIDVSGDGVFGFGEFCAMVFNRTGRRFPRDREALPISSDCPFERGCRAARAPQPFFRPPSLTC